MEFQLNKLTPLYASGDVRRADLHLRTKYFGLKTRIYLLEPHHYAILLLNDQEELAVIKKDFDHSIRPAAQWIDLVVEEPECFLEQIEPLPNVAHHCEGLYLNNRMFRNLLYSRFPEVEFVDFKVEHSNEILLKITTGKDTKEESWKQIGEFIAGLRLGFTKLQIENSSKSGDWYDSSVEMACTNRSLGFSRQDSEFWFDQMEQIYSGEIGKESLRFFDADSTKCYLNFSVWENENINLRNQILLYDKIYLSFPLGSHIDKVLQQQNLTLTDLEKMAERGKLVVFLPNTEDNYDKQALERLYHANKNSVVSKRGINALLAMHFCDLEKRYLSLWEGHEEVLHELCKAGMKSEDAKIRAMIKGLMWPMQAKTESFDVFNSYSPMKVAGIGVNRLFRGFLGDSEAAKNADFELTVNADSIHIATALQATYFPFLMKLNEQEYSDLAVAELLGSILNFYQYPGDIQQDSIREYSKVLENEQLAVSLLDSDNRVEIRQFLDYAEQYKTPETLKNILNHLAEMPQPERQKKVAEYSNLMAELGNQKGISKDSILNYVLTGVGFLPGVGTAASIVGLILQLVEDLKLREKWSFHRIAKQNSNVNEEVYLLDKLSRIARIR